MLTGQAAPPQRLVLAELAAEVQQLVQAELAAEVQQLVQAPAATPGAERVLVRQPLHSHTHTWLISVLLRRSGLSKVG